jgi:NADPH:quinone reductase-like Zn-dependent oxidoreductase
MKAIVLTKYGAPEVLQLREVATPLPKDDEVLIKVHAASVNDWDWCLMRGKPFYIHLICGLLKPKIKIPGVDVAGQIEAVGKNVKKFQPGDEVYGDISECGFGGFAEYVCARENALAIKPARMTFVEAAAIPHAAMLAIQGLRDIGQLQSGQKLLINGAGGGVGTLGVQIAKSIGVEEVAGVERSSKFDTMHAIGFEKSIDYTQEDFTKKEQRYDLILDTKTNRSTFNYLRALTPNGTYVTVGGTPARLLQAFFLRPIIRKFSKKNIRIVALKPNKDLDYVNELFEAGKIEPVIDGPYKLDEVPKAIQHFGEGKHKGKVVIALEHNDKT